MVLSPAKSLVEGPAVEDLPHTPPALLDDAAVLVERARALSVGELESLMSISRELADLNHARFQSWSRPFAPSNARQAALTFNGDVYQGLDAPTLTADDLAFGQEHLAILSGLYGVLRPLDLMQPYRLEMGSRLDNPRGPDLYAFWGDRITRELAARLASHATPTLVTLAAKEYFSSVRVKELPGPVVEPVFRDIRDGRARTISFFAKRARGEMARWALQERITEPEALKGFRGGGYTFQPSESTERRWIFTREQPPPAS